MSQIVFEGDSTGWPRASFHSSVAASQVHPFCPSPFSSTVTEVWAWLGASLSAAFPPPKERAWAHPRGAGGDGGVCGTRCPAPTAAAHQCSPCPGGDGEVLLGHVVRLPSESETADRRYAQLCSELPILPWEPGAAEHPDPGDPGDCGPAGGGREADLWVSFPLFSTSSVPEFLTLRIFRACCPAGGTSLHKT